MGKKQRRSVSLDADLNQRLMNESINVSEVANQLFREYVNRGDSREAGVAVRLREIDDEISDARQEIARQEARIEVLQEEKEDLRALQDEFHSSLDVAVEEALGRVRDGSWNPEYNSPDNPVVQDLAHQAGVTPERFVDELEVALDEHDDV